MSETLANRGVGLRSSPITHHSSLFLLLIAALCLTSAGAGAAMPQIELEANRQKLVAEVAITDADRMQGLMHRRMLPEHRGMLFVFPYAAPQSFWMMNTYIPLSIAFLDENGTIVNIADMKPLTTDSHRSAKPARYALEMNRGWFAKRNIRAGARVEGLERAPLPR